MSKTGLFGFLLEENYNENVEEKEEESSSSEEEPENRENNRERTNEYWRCYYATNKEQINQILHN